MLLGLKSRGLTKPPTLTVSDRALGFWRTLEEFFPRTRHQRRWVHKTANVLNYLPKHVQPKVKGALILVLLTVCAVIFFNPRFFHVSFASHNRSVMTALTPIIAVGTLACVLAMRNSLKLLFLDLLLIAFMWITISLFLTFSKGSWIAAIFIAGATLVYLARGRINKLMPNLGVVVMCLVVVVVFWPQASTVVSLRTNSSVIVRSATWPAAARGIADNFWEGPVSTRATWKCNL